MKENEGYENQPLLSNGRGKENGAAAVQEGPPFFIDYVRPCLAEFTGTTLFVFVGCMSGAYGASTLHIALAHGLTIFLLVTMLGHISGGHFNPAVTLGVVLSCGMKFILAPVYIVCQLLGGILGAALARGALGFVANQSSDNMTWYQIINGGATLGDPDASMLQWLLCEGVLTFVLVLTVLLSAVDRSHNLGPLAIGVALATSIMAAGKVSGASLNPARSLGPAVVAADTLSGVWKNHWVYWIGPALGAGFAALEYRIFFGSEDKRILFKPKRS